VQSCSLEIAKCPALPPRHQRKKLHCSRLFGRMPESAAAAVAPNLKLLSFVTLLYGCHPTDGAPVLARAAQFVDMSFVIAGASPPTRLARTVLPKSYGLFEQWPTKLVVRSFGSEQEEG
jgi:hypothetical protein